MYCNHEYYMNDVVSFSGYHIWRHVGDVNFDYSVSVLSEISLSCYSFVFFSLLQLITSLWGNTLRSCKYPAPHKNFNLNLASIDDSYMCVLSGFICVYECYLFSHVHLCLATLLDSFISLVLAFTS